MSKDTQSTKANEFSVVPNAREYMRPSAAAAYTGHSESTLAKLRMKHMRENGPAFIKRGGVILYRQADLDAWLDTFVVQ